MKWHRYRNQRGEIYYTTPLSETVVLQVWQEKNGWHWVLIGWPPGASQKLEHIVLRSGISRTLREAGKTIEDLLPKTDEQLVWVNL